MTSTAVFNGGFAPDRKNKGATSGRAGHGRAPVRARTMERDVTIPGGHRPSLVQANPFGVVGILPHKKGSITGRRAALRKRHLDAIREAAAYGNDASGSANQREWLGPESGRQSARRGAATCQSARRVDHENWQNRCILRITNIRPVAFTVYRHLMQHTINEG